ncbi:MAG: DUF5714 domain-containing protein [Spirochaetales bacterium]|jgi:hypothetical protein|nr:DUF5714 domain-containing protein [Spirochaetales bacterium]
MEQGHIVCPNGHYTCEHCSSQAIRPIIEQVLSNSSSTDPYVLVEQIFAQAVVPMLGCAHAYIAAGALLGAINNEGTIPGGMADIREVFKRTEKQAHGGYCGLTGVCGIAPALGAVVSLLSGARCGKDREQHNTMEAVTLISRAITDLTGPSCCKAYLWGSLKVMVSFVDTCLGVTLDLGDDPSCTSMALHPHGCRKEKCPYSGMK